MVKWLVAASVALLVALVGLLAYFLRPLSIDALPRFTNPVQITSAAGVEDFPTWSPDGAQVAFQSEQSGYSPRLGVRNTRRPPRGVNLT